MKRVITDKDICDIIKYAKENLGTYRILYKPCGKGVQYFLMIFMGIVMLITCIYDLYAIYTGKYTNLMIAINLIDLITLWIIYNDLKKFRMKMANHVQYKRKVKLSNYYSEKNYSDVELMFLVKLLQKKLDKNKTNIWYMFLVIGSLLFPVWNTFIERWLHDTPSMTIFFSIMVRVLAIAIVIPFVYLFSIPVNYVLTFNQRIAENIVYLTQFILSERGHNES